MQRHVGHLDQSLVVGLSWKSWATLSFPPLPQRCWIDLQERVHRSEWARRSCFLLFHFLYHIHVSHSRASNTVGCLAALCIRSVPLTPLIARGILVQSYLRA